MFFTTFVTMPGYLKIWILFLFIGSVCHGQSESEPANNLLYLEAGGFGGIGSLNYERISYSRGLFNIGPRFGFGFNRFKDFQENFNPDIAIPFGVHFTYGKRWKGEVGVGTTYTSVVHANSFLEPERASEVHGNLCVGVRYQNQTGGFLFRAGYSPIFERFSMVRHWPYLAVGFSF